MDWLEEFHSRKRHDGFRPIRGKAESNSLKNYFERTEQSKFIKSKLNFDRDNAGKKTKSPRNSMSPTEENSRQKAQIERNRTSGKTEKAGEDCFASPSKTTVKDEHLEVTIDSSYLNDSFARIWQHMPSLEELLNQVSSDLLCVPIMEQHLSI